MSVCTHLFGTADFVGCTGVIVCVTDISFHDSLTVLECVPYLELSFNISACQINAYIITHVLEHHRDFLVPCLQGLSDEKRKSDVYHLRLTPLQQTDLKINTFVEDSVGEVWSVTMVCDLILFVMTFDCISCADVCCLHVAW